MMTRVKKLKVFFLLGCVLLITLCHYVTELRAHHYHLVYQGVYFLPIMLAGFWFGLRGALSSSLSITILYLPFTLMHWEGFSGGDFNNVIEMILYNVVAVILGKLKDRERDQRKRLQEADRLAVLGKAVSALAHDLKTPLIAIGGLSRLIQKSLEKDSPSRKKLDLIIEETQRLEYMVTEMLNFSRPLELRRSSEDIDQVISQSPGIVADTAQKRKVKVQIQPSQNLPPISLDPPRMKQVLINLLVNAIEASPEGGIVSVHKYQKRKKIIIDVSDSGCGIPIDKKEEIFFPLFTTKEDGTGLGLPISKKIVEAHEGCLEILENPEGGLLSGS